MILLLVLKYVVLAYILAIFGVILGSWFPLEPDSAAHRAWVFCRRMTEPVLEPVRRVVPPVGGALDLSPIIVTFVLFAIYGLL